MCKLRSFNINYFGMKACMHRRIPNQHVCEREREKDSTLSIQIVFVTFFCLCYDLGWKVTKIIKKYDCVVHT